MNSIKQNLFANHHLVDNKNIRLANSNSYFDSFNFVACLQFIVNVRNVDTMNRPESLIPSVSCSFLRWASFLSLYLYASVVSLINLQSQISCSLTKPLLHLIKWSKSASLTKWMRSVPFTTFSRIFKNRTNETSAIRVESFGHIFSNRSKHRSSISLSDAFVKSAWFAFTE